MDRDLMNVIEKIIKEIPLTEENFINELNDRLSSVRYSAPELINMWWNETFKTLLSNLPKPEDIKEEWQFKVVSIFSGKCIDKIKEICNA